MALPTVLRFKILRTIINANLIYEGRADGLRVDPAWILMETPTWMAYSLPNNGVSVVKYDGKPLVMQGHYTVVYGKELTYYP